MENGIQSILNKYPKTREDLPNAYKDIYNEHYISNRSADVALFKLSSLLERWMHYQVAKFKINETNKDILELGAGTLNQVPYEKNYESYDVVEPFELLYANSPTISQVNTIYSDIADIVTTKKYDKISSIAAMEHVCNLPELIALSITHMKDGAGFVMGIPSEGELMWKVAYEMTTGLQFRKKYGLQYATLMNYEHVNTSKEIVELAKYFFSIVKIKYFGLCPMFSFYQYLECSNPNLERANEYLSSIKAK